MLCGRKGGYKSNGFKESCAIGPILPNTIDPFGPRKRQTLRRSVGNGSCPFFLLSSCLPGSQVRWFWATIPSQQAQAQTHEEVGTTKGTEKS